MIAHAETRVVPYPADLMFRIVADVERYPQFLPWVLALRILARAPGRMTAEMAVGYGALRERYTSDILLDEAAGTIDVRQTEGPFRCLENHWQFEAAEKGCKVDFAIRFEFRNRFLAKAAGSAFEKAMHKMIEAFEARAKTLSEAGEAT